MKALTVWQPWASLIAIGAKPWEFRGWKPPGRLVGQRIAIHAGARRTRMSEVDDLIDRLECEDLTACLQIDKALPFLKRVRAGLTKAHALIPIEYEDNPFIPPLSAIVCTAIVGEPLRGDACAKAFGATHGNDSDRDGHFNWGRPMLDVQQLVPSPDARGAQGLWDWNGV